jgi:membrane protease YdiL (CAAX protease family)
MPMMFSLAIVLVVLAYTWIFDPIAPRWARQAPTVIVLGLTIGRALKSGEWGLGRSEFLPALRSAALFTVACGLVMGLAGLYVGTWHDRRDGLGNFLALLPWAAGQQFVLQTAFLRDAQARISKPGGIWLAALVFGMLHLPNPFLAPVTCLAALAWCYTYDRHPNLLPLALSHALLTLVILYAFDDAITGRLRVGLAYLALR